MTIGRHELGYPKAALCWRSLGAAVVALLLLCAPTVVMAQSSGAPGGLAAVEARMTQFKLPNGLQFLVLERHDAPVVSFHTYVNVGSVDETWGMTGVAHVFEHLAFKGTTHIGTRDYAREKELEKKLDEVFDSLQKERRRDGEEGHKERMKALQDRFSFLQKEISKVTVQSEFDRIIERAGGVGLNASTSADATRYVVSLPSNRLELWFLMESERFVHPVIREFYKEKAVVLEERRMRTESNPIGRLLEEFQSIAYKAHPYESPTIGQRSDVEALTRPEAAAFYAKHYTANNMTISIVGDVDPARVRQLADEYFARLPSGTVNRVVTVEPPQLGERRVVIKDRAQPVLLAGYHVPEMESPDGLAVEALVEILGQGRTSRLHKRLVEDEKIAAQVSGFSGYPGRKYPGLAVFFAVPTPGHGNDELEKAIYAEIDRVRKDPVTKEELDRVKAQARADVIRGLIRNPGMAAALAEEQALTGDWRNLFRDVDRIAGLTPADLQRVAQRYFMEKNRTVARLDTLPPESTSGPAQDSAGK